MTKYYPNNDKFFVWAEDGILSDPNGYIPSISEVKELIKSQEKFISEHNQSEIDEYNNQVSERQYKFMEQENAVPVKRMSEKGYVYFVQADGRYFKIGSTTSLKSRIKGLKTSSPNYLVLKAYMETDDCRKDEELIHEMFKSKLVRGEWYDISYDELLNWSVDNNIMMCTGGDLIDECNGIKSLPD